MVEFDETTVLLVTFVVLLAPLPLTSVGTTGGQSLLWQVGLALLVVAGVVPPLTRFVFSEGGEEDEDGEEDGDAEGDDAGDDHPGESDADR